MFTETWHRYLAIMYLALNRSQSFLLFNLHLSFTDGREFTFVPFICMWALIVIEIYR